MIKEPKTYVREKRAFSVSGAWNIEKPVFKKVYLINLVERQKCKLKWQLQILAHITEQLRLSYIPGGTTSLENRWKVSYKPNLDSY